MGPSPLEGAYPSAVMMNILVCRCFVRRGEEWPLIGGSPNARGLRRLISQGSMRANPVLAGRACGEPPVLDFCVGHPRAAGARCRWLTAFYSVNGPPPRGGACGRRWVSLDDYEGPSPQLRGLPCPTLSEQTRSGAIPGLTGPAVAYLSASMVYEDHPRTGGAYATVTRRDPKLNGPSPEWAGPVVRHKFAFVDTGTIPAPAGLTDI